MKNPHKKKPLTHLIPVLVGDEHESITTDTTTRTVMRDENSSSLHQDQFPVIQLEHIPPLQPEVVQAFVLDQGDTQPADVVVAVPTTAGVAFSSGDHEQNSTQEPIIPRASLVRDSSLQDVELGSDGHHHAATSWLSPREVPSSSPLPPQEERPRGEYISVTTNVPSPTTTRMGASNSIGIQFLPDQAGVVACILGGSTLDIVVPSPLLQPGDEMISINGKTCTGLTLQEIDRLMMTRGTNGERQYLNLIFHKKTKYADANLVEAMIVKGTCQNESFGLRLACSLPAGDHVQIYEILPHGLIAQSSLLNVGDTILAVNGISCAGLTISAVVDILRSAPKHVHILAQPGPNSAMVVAEMSPTRKNHRAAGALRYKEAYSNDKCRCRGLLIGLLFIVVVLFLVIVVASSNSGNRDRYDGHQNGNRDSWDGS